MERKVKIYSLTECPHCLAAKAFLKSKNIKFEDINVEEEKNAEEATKISGQNGVPVILIGDNMIIGFNKEKIENLIEKEKW